MGPTFTPAQIKDWTTEIYEDGFAVIQIAQPKEALPLGQVVTIDRTSFAAGMILGVSNIRDFNGMRLSELQTSLDLLGEIHPGNGIKVVPNPLNPTEINFYLSVANCNVRTNLWFGSVVGLAGYYNSLDKSKNAHIRQRPNSLPDAWITTQGGRRLHLDEGSVVIKLDLFEIGSNLRNWNRFITEQYPIVAAIINNLFKPTADQSTDQIDFDGNLLPHREIMRHIMELLSYKANSLSMTIDGVDAIDPSLASLNEKLSQYTLLTLPQALTPRVLREKPKQIKR